MAVILLGGNLPGPDSVAGLTGWWDAGFQVYSDAGTTLAVDGNTVQQWNDRSVGGNNLSQATAGNRPTYKTGIVNGQSVVRFGGATDDDYMSTVAVSTFFAASAKTAFVVSKHANNVTSTIFSDVNDREGLWHSNTGTGLSSINFDGTQDGIEKGGLSSGTWYIGTYMHNGTTLYAGANDTRTSSLASVASGASTDLTGSFQLGRRTPGTPSYLDGDIAEVVVYNQVLSETDRQTVERYLAVKYGITLPY